MIAHVLLTVSKCIFFLTGAVTCTDVDMHKIVSGSNDRTVKVMSLFIFSAFCNCQGKSYLPTCSPVYFQFVP